MPPKVQTWEAPLLDMAYQTQSEIAVDGRYPIHHETLTRAYAHCDAKTAAGSRSFYLASRLLPAEKRRAVRALYAFCRVSDDIVDEGGADRTEQWIAWRQRLDAAKPPADDLVAVAWAETRQRYGVPARYVEQLLDGVAADLQPNSITTFADLAAYSYGVASTVALMSMHIIGFANNDAIPYAVKLGVALQITNILRDVAEDWMRGRLYLPTKELDAFGIDVEILAASVAAKKAVVADRWRAFMRFQIERNREIYAEAMPGIRLLDASGRFAVTAAADLYRGILDDIEQHDYDVFSRRAYVTQWGKLRRLPSIWQRSRFPA